MVWIPGGSFMMGSNDHYPEEAPVHPVTVNGFWMDQFTVTNAQFSRFVEETGYVTSAERAPRAEDYPGAKPELLVPASVVFRRPGYKVDLNNHYNWWTYIPEASWRRPQGPVALSKDWRNILWSISRSKTPRLLRNGREKNCQLKPSGSSPRAVAWKVQSLPGDRSSRLTIATWQTRGKVIFQMRTPSTTGSNGRRLSDRFRQTAMGFTTWQATFGSGPRIGTSNTTSFRIPVAAASIHGAVR